MERADHSGHVDQRRPLGPALGQRSGRLPLEVDNHVIGAGPNHLAQMIIAVAANFLPLDRLGPDFIEASHEPRFTIEHRFGGRQNSSGNLRQPLAEEFATAGGEIAHQPVERFVIFGRKRLRGERRIVIAGGERQMQFGRPLSKQRRKMEIVIRKRYGRLGRPRMRP